MTIKTLVVALVASALPSLGMAKPPGGSPSVPVIQAGPLTISHEARDLIIHYEIGSEGAYRARYTRPIWPGGASGVTVGIGSDLGYITSAQIAQQWAHLGQTRVRSLQTVAGLKGQNARAALGRVRHVVISWEEAMIHFEKSTLPRWGQLTNSAFPNLSNIHPHCQGAVKSIAFNRGTSMSGGTRREMVLMRDDIARNNLRPVPGHILAMRRLWVGKGLDGLLRRRAAEAALFQKGIDA
jgi:hypothetical protein